MWLQQVQQFAEDRRREIKFLVDELFGLIGVVICVAHLYKILCEVLLERQVETILQVQPEEVSNECHAELFSAKLYTLLEVVQWLVKSHSRLDYF